MYASTRMLPLDKYHRSVSEPNKRDSQGDNQNLPRMLPLDRHRVLVVGSDNSNVGVATAVWLASHAAGPSIWRDTSEQARPEFTNGGSQPKSRLSFFLPKRQDQLDFSPPIEAQIGEISPEQEAAKNATPRVFRKRANHKSRNAQPRSEREPQSEARFADCAI